MLPLLLPYCCQAPTGAPGPFLWRVSCSSMCIRRADERTQTAFLLITSVRSVVASCCTGLQIPHKNRGFCSLCCPLSHRISFPAVSEWCQSVLTSAVPALSLGQARGKERDVRERRQGKRGEHTQG